jgi:hypothetical protein
MAHLLSVETVGKTLRNPTCPSEKTPARLPGIRAWFRRMIALSAAGLPTAKSSNLVSNPVGACCFPSSNDLALITYLHASMAGLTSKGTYHRSTSVLLSPVTVLACVFIGVGMLD